MGKVTCPRCLKVVIKLNGAPHYRDIFSCHNLGGGTTGFEWVGARNAAKNPAVLQCMGQSPITKNYPVQHVSGTKDEKP